MTEPKRLLMLDDEAAIGQLVCRVARRAGYEARYCTNAGRFFDELRDWLPGLVLVDLVMPGLDGVEVLCALARERTAAKVILVSGFDFRVLESAARAARARGLAVAGILPKPFSLSVLRAMLDAEPAPRAAERGPAHPLLEIAEIDRALGSGEFFMVYQPKWSLEEQRVLGFEALVRWRHPLLGIIDPDRFIPQAERCGRIAALTEHVLRSSLAWFGSLDVDPAVLLEVNISGANLGALSPDRIGALCAQFGVPAERMVLEITETSQIADTLQATDVLNRLRIKGFGLAIDDYGMGYSSMSQLALFPFTELKIDKTFVDPLTRSSDMRAMVSSMIGLARDMGLTTVAEGVEDASTVSVLRDMGCDAIQGYVVARPMDAGHARAWLSEHAP